MPVLSGRILQSLLTDKEGYLRRIRQGCLLSVRFKGSLLKVEIFKDKVFSIKMFKVILLKGDPISSIRHR